MTSKTSTSLPEVDYTYDLLGRALTAKFTSGQGITNVYDALGRVTSSTTNVGGTSHALTYAYDLAGNRTQMNWWDGFYINYDRLVTGEISKFREDGATSGAGVLATYAYNNLGQRTSLTAGNGAVTSWSYDPVGRLASLTQDLAGTANDLTVTDSYSPASQIVSAARSNDTYAYTQSVDVNRGYTSNGLNQYSAAMSAALIEQIYNVVNSQTNAFYRNQNRETKNGQGGTQGTVALPKKAPPKKKQQPKPDQPKSDWCETGHDLEIAGNAGIVTGGLVAGVGLLTGPGEAGFGTVGGAIAMLGGTTASAGWLIRGAAGCQ